MDKGNQVNKIVYLSGPMSGYKDYNFPAFKLWATRLRDAGYNVVSPAETAGGAKHLPRNWYFRFDFAVIATVDEMLLMPGWCDSAGAKAEAIMAHEMGIPLFELCLEDRGGGKCDVHYYNMGDGRCTCGEGGSLVMVRVHSLSWDVTFYRGEE